ncbi:flagellar motor protein MotB [Povalibacter uvarum]|uniref:Flagellar motor protein MotB n=1 Tax=Povalibacter uvarum TaxID=732238 RepID=A0A841HT82_9GAMM|nr:OmpA family protein [Povalibacter uvarum]MBB6095509.1 flagellar motor protein MotB [Povalibacter uvarum]
MDWIIRIVWLGLFVTASALAGEDLGGAKDHPLLTRYPDSYITEYTKNYDATEFKVGPKASPKTQTIEGDTTTLRYFYESVEKQPSALQLIRNYQNAVKQIGGTVVYERLPGENDGGETTMKVTTGGKDVWIKVTPDIFGAPTTSYQLIITEVAAMAQVVTANELLQELNKNGFIALYINFDTGKSDLKQDGTATVKEIAAMMKSNPGLKLAVEGHTDNVGDAAANKKLSEARAKSVTAAIVASGVDASRLSAAGFGQERPVADNRTEEGRAKNRRVELVKK